MKLLPFSEFDVSSFFEESELPANKGIVVGIEACCDE